MRRPTIIHFSLILLAGAACGFAADQVNDSPFPGARPLPEDFVEVLFPGISDADGEIYQKLNKKTSVNFDKTPLADALKLVSKTTNIPIVLDLISLEEAGLHRDDPVTLQANNVSARTILKLVLDQFEMAYVVEDAVVKVTTFEVSCRKLTTGIFPVADLVTNDRKSWKALSNLIQGETDGLWERTDGSGGTVSTNRATKSLIVRQTPEVLDEIQRLLGFLRATKRIGGARVNPPSKPEPQPGRGGKKGGLGGGGFF